MIKLLHLLGIVVDRIIDWERIMDRIRAGEEKIKEQQDRIDVLHRKIKATRFLSRNSRSSTVKIKARLIATKKTDSCL